MSKTGLVLSGGGAKGAYQVGVMKALLELNVPVDMLSGASIGALNAAVLASAPNLQVGTEHLEKVWAHLAENNPLSIRGVGGIPSSTIKTIFPYLLFLSSAGLRANPWIWSVSALFMLLKKYNLLDKIPSLEDVQKLSENTA